MNIIKDKRIAIIGGGPGGLTLARLLQLRGADVIVYERDVNKDVRVQGATLDLHEESGLKALHTVQPMMERRFQVHRQTLFSGIEVLPRTCPAQITTGHRYHNKDIAQTP